MHATAEEARDFTIKMLNVYADFHTNDLAIPVIKGAKTPSDKFAGAEDTYCIEAMMHDGKALQAATSHYFGDGFAKAFDIQYTDKDNKLRYPHQTSWGCTTRMIGGIIMTHGDDNGLVLPPAVAPIQVVIIPVAMHKEGVLEENTALYNRLKDKFRTKLDDSDNSPGWKFAEYEMRGVPVRIEMGPRDIENGERRTYSCTSIDEIKEALTHGDGLVKAMWCGDEACEDKVKELTGVGSRCIPFDQEHLSDTCVCCGKPAKHMVYWGIAY